MAVYQLDDELWFPDPHHGEPDGLIAVGGDLSVNRLLLAYSYGFFPWFSFRFKKEPYWYCPLDRYVIFPKDIHVSHSMRQLMRKNKYTITFNQAFDQVIRKCSTVNGRHKEAGAWLGQQIINAYTALHNLGYAASVEVWQQDATLVGGLYGVVLRNAFFGESMFAEAPNTSKLALIHLAKHMEENGGLFIDCQFETPHLKSMGGKHISFDEYLKILE